MKAAGFSLFEQFQHRLSIVCTRGMCIEKLEVFAFADILHLLLQ